MFYNSILVFLAAVGLYMVYWALDTIPHYNIMNSWLDPFAIYNEAAERCLYKS